jgi:hypothetical protein
MRHTEVFVARGHPSPRRTRQLPGQDDERAYSRALPIAEADGAGHPLATVLLLLSGTQMITLVHERLGHKVGEAAGIRLLEPPIPRPNRSPRSWPGRTGPTETRGTAGSVSAS